MGYISALTYYLLLRSVHDLINSTQLQHVKVFTAHKLTEHQPP